MATSQHKRPEARNAAFIQIRRERQAWALKTAPQGKLFKNGKVK